MIVELIFILCKHKKNISVKKINNFNNQDIYALVMYFIVDFNL